VLERLLSKYHFVVDVAGVLPSLLLLMIMADVSEREVRAGRQHVLQVSNCVLKNPTKCCLIVQIRF
jgi:hypothetical protein